MNQVIAGVDTSVSSPTTTFTVTTEETPSTNNNESTSSKVAKNILLQMRGVTLTPEDADEIVEELGHVVHGWDKKDIVPIFSNPADAEKYAAERAYVKSIPTVVRIVNGTVEPNLRVLLASVLGTIDASMPNKEQNKAVKHIIRKDFDDAYFDILRRSYPDSNFASDESDYAVQPEPNKRKAFSEGFLNQS
jgi:hypothetical protein